MVRGLPRRRPRLTGLVAVVASTALVVSMAAAATASEGPAPEPAPVTTVADSADAPVVPATESPDPVAPPADPAPEEASPAEVPTETAAPDASEDTGDPTPSPQPTAPATSTGRLATAPAGLVAAAAEDCPAPGASSLVGGFEIDGNTCVNDAGIDWDTPVGDSVDDGFTDSTTFGVGSAENTNPATWSNGPAPNGKTDIGKAWAWSQTAGGHVYAYFALTNNSTSGGTSQYDLEYNQAENVVNDNGLSVPSRTPGDLLFRFSSSGSDPISFDDAKIYRLQSDPDWSGADCFLVGGTSPAAGWCDIDNPPSSFAQQVNDDGTFFEGVIDLTILFQAGEGCSGTFGTVNIRSVTGNSFDSSSLKDRVAPLDVSTPSTCSTLVIKKFAGDSDTLVTGAHFDVYAGATASGTPLFADVTDGGSADSDTVVGQITIKDLDPGTYTVKETQAPSGYLLPTPDTQTKTVGESETVAFGFHDPKKWQPLDFTATAVGSYDVSYAWSIVKGVRVDASGEYAASAEVDDASGSHTFGYRIEVTEGAKTISDKTLGGSISVTNPNSAAVVVDFELTPPAGYSQCGVTGGDNDRSVAAGGSSFAYICTPVDATAEPSGGTVGVSMSWSKADYPQSEADLGSAGANDVATSVTPAYTVTETGKTVTLSDDRYTFTPTDPVEITWSEQGKVHTYAYDREVTGTAGACTTSVNTATITSGGATVGQASATAKLCVGADLEVTKNVVGTITRSYLWTIDKTVCSEGVDPAVCVFTPTFTVGEDGKVTVPYQVTVTPNGSRETGWVMSGAITVSNPNDFAAVSLTEVSDVFSGGGTCVVDTSGGFSVPKSGSKVYPYTCTFTSQPSHVGTNTASVEWDATFPSPAHTATKGVPVNEADWSTDEAASVNKTIGVYDDKTDPDNPVLLGQADWDEGPRTFSYSLELEGVPGRCVPVRNTAYLAQSADGDRLDSDDVDVTVCAPEKLTVAKTVDGTFDRAYQWDLVKKVKDHDGNWVDATTRNVDAYSAGYDYRVTLTQKDPVDSDYRMSGTITLTNPNDDSVGAITTDVDEVPALGGDATAVCTTGDHEPFPLEDVSVPAGESVVIDYACAITGTPGADPTNQVPATSTLTGVSEDVTFEVGKETDKSVKVYDDKTDPDNPVLVGARTYGDEGAPSWDFDYSVTVSTDSTECEEFVNTAQVFGDAEAALATDTATATLCPNAGEWKTYKTSDPVSGSTVLPGQTITYTLHAEKTGGADPKDVVIDDDLTDVLNHASFETSDEDLAAQGLSRTGDTLTWTIPSLGDTPRTVSYTVKVDADAWNATLKNSVTRGDGGECEPADCTTTHLTPRYTLEKSSDKDGKTVQPGTVVSYTLKVTNASDNGAVLPAFEVVDNMAAVVNSTSAPVITAPGAGQTASYSAAARAITWTGAGLSLEPGESVTLTYKVTINANAWNRTIHNVATPKPGTGGECVAAGSCETTSHTPPQVSPPVVKPPTPKPPKVKPPKSLPNTGGPAPVWLYGGIGLVFLGGVLLLSRGRRSGH